MLCGIGLGFHGAESQIFLIFSLCFTKMLMKNFRLPVLLLFALVLIGSGCKTKKASHAKTDDRVLPEGLAAAYREDAARLAVRELNTTTQPGDLEAVIPQDKIDYYFGLLTKIYWKCVDDDSIPDLSGIHTLKRPHLQRVRVVLQKDSPFKENWSKGVTLTSNLYLNQLIAKHKLTIKDYRETGMGPTLVFESPGYLNTTELSFLIKNFETIRTAEPEGVAGDGNDITWGTDAKNALALKYSIGAGDCPSGCIQRKFWIFYILPDGSINYMGTRGSIPAELEPK